MTTSVYILRVDAEVAEGLAAEVAPGRGVNVEYVRLATVVPIDTYGFGESSMGSMVGVSAIGVTVVSRNQGDAPTVVVPWTNVASLSFAPTTQPDRPEVTSEAPAGKTRRGDW